MKKLGSRWLWQAMLEQSGKKYQGVTSWEREGRKVPLSPVSLNLKPNPARKGLSFSSLLPSLWNLPCYIITLLAPLPPVQTHQKPSCPPPPATKPCLCPLTPVLPRLLFQQILPGCLQAALPEPPAVLVPQPTDLTAFD